MQIMKRTHSGDLDVDDNARPTRRRLPVLYTTATLGAEAFLIGAVLTGRRRRRNSGAGDWPAVTIISKDAQVLIAKMVYASRYDYKVWGETEALFGMEQCLARGGGGNLFRESETSALIEALTILRKSRESK